MIKRPWQIWTIYALCVLLVLPAMVWLTLTTWRLDQAREDERRETEIARREAELQERVSSALWRMDWLMIPLVAQEAARPHYMYRSFYTDTAEKKEKTPADSTSLRPSPLLAQPSDFILLHFQIEPDGKFSSPQSPEGELREQAVSMCSVPLASIDSSDQRVAELRQKLTYESICAACPATKLPPSAPIQYRWQSGELGSQIATNQAAQDEQFVGNDAPQAASQLQQQIEASSQQRDNEVGPQQKISQQQSLRSAERANREYLSRNKATQTYAKGQSNVYNVDLLDSLDSKQVISEGVMRPIWINDLLVLARRVDLADRTVIQGCWLDWNKIKSALMNEVADVLPGAGLEPVQGADETATGRRMATLPVQLAGVEQSLATITLPGLSLNHTATFSGLKLALGVAWLGLVLGLIAIAVLLRGVIRLSERRADFASAVTHELRTPLTTFRMYAEMLSEGMVPSPEKQRQYARTMKVEADRLGHLVENVLRYARLERRTVATRKEATTVDALLHRFRNRLIERAESAGMKLSIELDEATRHASISTDPQTVEQIVFNLVDNACKYAAGAADKTVHLAVASNHQSSPHASRPTPHAGLSITVRDHGPGIDARMSKRLFTAFSKSDQDAAETARGVGLGLSLCRRLAADLGGKLAWDKDYTDGASFTLQLPA